MGGQLTIVSSPVGHRGESRRRHRRIRRREQEFALEQAQFDLRLAEQEIVKAEAEAAVQAADDEVALLKARFDVRRAELDARPTSWSAPSRRNRTCCCSRKRGSVWRSSSRTSRAIATTAIASAAVLREKRNKAQLAGRRRERNIDNLAMRAPFDGFVTVRPNMMAFGGIVFFGRGDAGISRRRFHDPGPADRRLDRHVARRGHGQAARARSRQRRARSDGGGVRRCLARRELRGTVRAVSGVASRQIFEGGASAGSTSPSTSTASHARVRPGVSAALVDRRSDVRRRALCSAVGGVRCRRQAVGLRANGGWLRASARGAIARTDTVAVIEGLERIGGSRARQPEHGAPARGRVRSIGARRAAARRAMSQGRAPRAGTDARRAAARLGRSIDNLLLHKLRTLLTMLGHDLRRRGGAVDAVDRRRRAAAGDGVHRGSRRQEPHRRGARNDRVAGEPEDPAAVAGPHVPGPARDPGVGARARGADAAQAVLADAGGPEADSDAPGRLRRRTELPADRRSLRVTAGRFFTADEAARAAAVCVLGEAARVAAVRRHRPARTLRQDERAVVPGHRHRRPAGRRAERRRRHAGAGSQQSHLRADVCGDAAAGRQLLAVPRRDRRHLSARLRPMPTSPPRRRSCAAFSTAATAAPATTR